MTRLHHTSNLSGDLDVLADQLMQLHELLTKIEAEVRWALESPEPSEWVEGLIEIDAILAVGR